jgi:hypothetical protein
MTTIDKFIKNSNGIHCINPAFVTQNNNTNICPVSLNQSTALPVVSTIEQHDLHLGNTKISDTVVSSVEILQDVEVAQNIGLQPDQTMQQITRIFAKYEIPIGLTNKLLGISDFRFIEMLVDDSGSMNTQIEFKDISGKFMSRWEEVQTRMMQMFEILVCVPFPPTYIRFLNRSDIIEIKREASETPDMFIKRITDILTRVFAIPPSGTTPARERIAESLARCQGQAVLRYFFGDGLPNGGALAVKDITNMIIHRPNFEHNPFTFISCTSNDADVEWMKECEEVAPFCAEFDDFQTESREVINDQGLAFPFTFGMYLIGQLIAACNPNDLDAMDESVPFTKQTLDNMQGYVCSPQDYEYYFNEFINAQASKQITSVLDKFKKDYLNVWHANIAHFRTAPIANQIPVVQYYRTQIYNIKKSGV